MRRLKWIALVLVLLGGAHWLWNSNPVRLKDRVLPREFAKVEPHLYRSGQIDRGLIEGVLNEHSIDYVVDLQLDESGVDRDEERRLLAEKGLHYVQIPMPGSGIADADAYARAVAAIQGGLDDGRNVLVHCTAGGRRTGGVLAAWELLVRGDEARANQELERCAYSGDPARLRAFHTSNLAAIAARLAELNVAVIPPPEHPLADGS
jgi:protein-tyrosine phosphatase